MQETDLFISADRMCATQARDAVLQARMYIQDHIRRNPLFQTSLRPVPLMPHAPAIIQEMIAASSACSVGPMAAVAGAIAEYVGTDLLKNCSEVIVENGGDVFLSVRREITAGIFAGSSPLSNRIGLKILPETTPLGICTSSGTVGHSLSLGSADAATVVAANAALADAAATALGNMVRKHDDIPLALDAASRIPGIVGALIIFGDVLGAWGSLDIVEL